MWKLKEKYKNLVIFNYDRLNENQKVMVEKDCLDFLNKYCIKT
tara:strand:- start:8858 stop:8986 length:129 start_codon:yes stop_codon:yes gene_type:complete